MLLSVGIDDPEDLIADLDQWLAALRELVNLARANGLGFALRPGKNSIPSPRRPAKAGVQVSG